MFKRPWNSKRFWVLQFFFLEFHVFYCGAKLPKLLQLQKTTIGKSNLSDGLFCMRWLPFPVGFFFERILKTNLLSTFSVKFQRVEQEVCRKNHFGLAHYGKDSKTNHLFCFWYLKGSWWEEVFVELSSGIFSKMSLCWRSQSVCQFEVSDLGIYILKLRQFSMVSIRDSHIWESGFSFRCQSFSKGFQDFL